MKGDLIERLKRMERDEEIFRRYFLKGESYREIGREFGLSHERVRQICMKLARKKRMTIKRKTIKCPSFLMLAIKREEEMFNERKNRYKSGQKRY